MEIYKKKREEQYNSRLRSALDELPSFLTAYFTALTTTKSITTCLGYATNLKVFFQYIREENPLYKSTPVKEIPFDVLSMLTTQDIEEFLMNLASYRDENGNLNQNGPSAKSRMISAIRSMYKYYHKNQFIDSNPSILLESPRIPQKEIRVLSDQQVEKLFSGIESGEGLTDIERSYYYRTCYRDIALITLFLDTGMRVSELAALDMKDIIYEGNRLELKENLDDIASSYDLRYDALTKPKKRKEALSYFLSQCRKFVHEVINKQQELFPYMSKINILRKGGKTSILYIGANTQGILYAYMYYIRPVLLQNESEEAVFVSIKKKRLTVDSVEKMTARQGERYIYETLTPHYFRRTYGTNSLALSGDLLAVSDALGHASTDVTSRHYTKLSEERKRRLVEMNQKTPNKNQLHP